MKFLSCIFTKIINFNFFLLLILLILGKFLLIIRLNSGCPSKSCPTVRIWTRIVPNLSSWSFLMTSWRLLQYSWSIGKDQDFFWNILDTSSFWHVVTLLDMSWASWRRLSSFLMSSCLLLDDSWVDLPILGEKKKKRKKEKEKKGPHLQALHFFLFQTRQK